MRFLVQSIGAVVVSLSIAGCDEFPSSSETSEDRETAQMVAAARAVTEDVPMNTVIIRAPSKTLHERRGNIREALGVAEAECELETCTANDIAALVHLNFLRVVQNGDDQARISVDRLVPYVERGGDVEWSGKMYDVRLQRDNGEWTVTAARLILES